MGANMGNPANTTLINYGGYDYNSGYPYIVGSLDPTSATSQYGYCNSGSGNDNCAGGLQYDTAGDVCKDINDAKVSTVRFASRAGHAVSYAAQCYRRSAVSRPPDCHPDSDRESGSDLHLFDRTW